MMKASKIALLILLSGLILFGLYVGSKAFTIYSNLYACNTEMNTCTANGNTITCPSHSGANSNGNVLGWQCQFTTDINDGQQLQSQIITPYLSQKQGFIGTCQGCAPGFYGVAVESTSKAMDVVNAAGHIQGISYGTPADIWGSNVKNACSVKPCAMILQDSYTVLPAYFDINSCKVHISSVVGPITATGVSSGYDCKIDQSSYDPADVARLNAWDAQQGQAQNDPSKARTIGSVTSVDFIFANADTNTPVVNNTNGSTLPQVPARIDWMFVGLLIGVFILIGAIVFIVIQLRKR